MILNFFLLIGSQCQVTTSVTKFGAIPDSIVYLKQGQILLQQKSKLYKSPTGKSFTEIPEINTPFTLIPHPNFPKTAFVITKTTHFYTKDGGSSWTKFTTPFPAGDGEVIEFNGVDEQKMIIQLNVCDAKDCRQDSYYTTDSFRNIKVLNTWTSQCLWAININKQVRNINIEQ
jgi:hypothetical protein